MGSGCDHARRVQAGRTRSSRARAREPARGRPCCRFYYSWDQPDARWILGLAWLPNVFHPDAVQTDINREMREFFTFAFGMTEAQIDQIIVPVLEGVETE